MADDQNYEIGRLAAEIEAASAENRRYRAKDYWTPYPKQSQFFATGLQFRERGLFAGTQLGKTESAAYEMACHLTGEYPPDWPGRKFDKPVRAWAVGDSLKMVRDICQKKLCGEPGDAEAKGSGMIPKDRFVGDPVLARGETNAYDSIQIRHASGGVSTLRFRTYQAGAMALQGETLDCVWLDEEPADYAVYSECLARVGATGGMLWITFTPLRGMSEISLRYRNEFSPDRTFVQFGIDDVPPDGHIKPADRARILAGYAEHEREARARGEPLLGSGRIYKTPEADIVEDVNHLSFPTYWKWGYGIDLGIDHPWAAALMAWDTDQDVIHIVGELRVNGQNAGPAFRIDAFAGNPPVQSADGFPGGLARMTPARAIAAPGEPLKNTLQAVWVADDGRARNPREHERCRRPTRSRAGSRKSTCASAAASGRSRAPVCATLRSAGSITARMARSFRCVTTSWPRPGTG